MKRAIFPLMIVVLGLGVFLTPAAAAVDSPFMRLSDKNIRRMGFDTFCEYYCRKADDHSEGGYDAAADAYAHALRRLNDSAARRYPATLQKQMAQIRRLAEIVEIGWLRLEMARALGGTFYSHMGARSQGWREEFMEDVIADFGRSTADTEDLARARAAWQSTYDSWAGLGDHLETAAYAEEMDSGMLEMWSDQYREARQEIAGALAAAKALLPRLPPAVAARFGRYLERCVFTIDE